MTKEEAIKRLKEARNTMQPFQYVNEAIDYAIKALEQQPSEDCISREALDDAISDLTYWHFENGRLITGGGGNKSETVYKVDDVTRLTHILPPVTPQQATWIPVSENGDKDNGKI